MFVTVSLRVFSYSLNGNCLSVRKLIPGVIGAGFLWCWLAHSWGGVYPSDWTKKERCDFEKVSTKIWFMDFLFIKFVVEKRLPFGRKVYKFGDKGWLEFYGGQGLHEVFTLKSWFLEVGRRNIIKLHIITFLIIISAMFLIS